jgi:hypothetical protein
MEGVFMIQCRIKGLLLLILGLTSLGFVAYERPKIDAEVTELAIFIDLPAQNAGNNAIPHEFIKAIDATCN